ncbi:branched-chain amino acid ABC transporter periplasmic protein [Alcanivorax sp. S71-1-4]|uniref:ABC transporter substrate-binding protein n=1 Tax=Alcanivorax sp. S71-1-4 TaxID=1177159 RepID=UPI00135B6640|nr:ABC transporter substrate-binding protein [Alcanivorax sp. S71-1-4]KAF0805640.1 branched-chain amino acid ABC transporter periplasmic protein [Alcanivorax sp. S71-1-4]
MKKTTALLVTALASATAMADINIGISLSTTGPGASLGIPERNTVALLPKEVGGEKINYIVLDDATDSTAAAKNARKFVDEQRVDLIIASSTVPTSSVVAQIARESRTPQIALAPFAPTGDDKTWVFTVAQTNELMASVLFEHMRANNVKTLGYIGYSDAWGDDWHAVLTSSAEAQGFTVISNERFNRTDSSVAGQALRVNRGEPDAVLIGATGTPAALPHTALRRLGYKGLIYHTHGAANQSFLRIGGSALEGAVLPVGPVVMWNQLPDSHPSKSVAAAYARDYEAAHGEGSLSPFGAYLMDAGLLIERAAAVALQQAEPGTPAFRAALRDALESTRDLAGTHGVYNLSAEDHFGHDERARVLIQVSNHQWELLSAGD